MAYSKDAFNCARCPGKAGDGGCPMWWDTIWEKPDGEAKIVSSCGFTQLPLYLTEVIKASNRPAAAIESTRNEIVKGFQGLAQAAPLLARLSRPAHPSVPPVEVLDGSAAQ